MGGWGEAPKRSVARSTPTRAQQGTRPKIKLNLLKNSLYPIKLPTHRKIK
ncbi:MAG: hypothetical protein NZ455_01970 [Bacteroidia bacterium]|nr:hypothetical protein [Bacteroidia bacterium]